MKENLPYQIAIQQIPEVGLQRAKDLIQHFGSAKAFFEATDADMRQIPNVGSALITTIQKGKAAALRRAEDELKFIEQHKISTYYFEDEDYPERLRQCPDAPILLFAKGNVNLSEGKFVSIVGTRRSTDRGRQLTHDLVCGLAEKLDKVTIVSGLAYGIDIASHRAALEAGIPTIMVTAHGLDRIYPAEHRKEAVQALEQGGIVTEYISKTTPERGNFLQRNRIIAGLADAVVVVEAQERSGSLNTASTAFSYSREVFAFPGRPTDDNNKGCNALIKTQKAALIESADDLINAMLWDEQKKAQNSPVQASLFPDLTADEQHLVEIINTEEDGKHINLIVAESGQPYSQVSSQLMLLEIKGIVKQLPGNLYKVRV